MTLFNTITFLHVSKVEIETVSQNVISYFDKQKYFFTIAGYTWLVCLYSE